MRVTVELWILLTVSAHACCLSVSNNSYLDPEFWFSRCNRSKEIHICDPDRTLTQAEANKLDWLSAKMMSSTPCLCPHSCPASNSGVRLGMYITSEIFNVSRRELHAFVKQLRLRRSLGKCDDDILIVLLAETKQAEFDMGLTVEKAITKKTARQIFKECAVHFENRYFYQGLESMVNSFWDSLRSYQPMNPKFSLPATSLIVGVSLGMAVLVLMLTATALLKCRQMQQMKAVLSRQRDAKSHLAPKNTEATAFQYTLCSGQDEKGRRGSSSSDEGIDSDDDTKGSETARLHVPPPFSDTFRRQLSDVLEENEDEVEAAAIKFALNNVPKNSNTHVTEL